MADSFTPYIPQNTGVATGQTISSANEKNDRASVQTSTADLNTFGQDTSNFKYSFQNQTYIRDFDITTVSTGPNTIAISSGATTLYDFSTDTEQTGWANLASTNVSAISSGVIWAIYPGKTYTVTDDDPVSRPANSYRVAIFTNVAGTVTVIDNWQNPVESKENIFEENNIFRKDFQVGGDAEIAGDLNVTGDLTASIKQTVTEIDNTDSPYTVLTTDSYINADASSGAITVNLYAASGNTGRRLVVSKTDSSSNIVTLDGNASETISGQTTIKLNSQYRSQSLYCDGSNWIIESPSLGALRFISTQEISSSVSSVEITSGIDNTYESFLIEIVGLTISADDDVVLQVSEDGGTNYNGGASDYEWAYDCSYNYGYGFARSYISLTPGLVNSSFKLGGGTGQSLLASIRLLTPSDSTSNKVIGGTSFYRCSGASYTAQTFSMCATHEKNTNAINAIKIFCSGSATLDSGVVTLYGIVS